MPLPLDRLVPLLIALACAAPLIIGATLTPSGSGTGTHTQLGLSPCGFKAATGLPCLTCGMTTAFTHAAHGDLASAFVVQPAGTLLALTCAMAVIVCGYAAIAGASLAPLGRALWRPKVLLAVGAVALLGWLYTLIVTLGTSS